MNWIIIIGLLAATCTTLSFLPQVIKIVKTKKTSDISLLMYVILTTGILLWALYGLLIMDLPVLLANSVTFILALIVLILKIKHG